MPVQMPMPGGGSVCRNAQCAWINQSVARLIQTLESGVCLLGPDPVPVPDPVPGAAHGTTGCWTGERAHKRQRAMQNVGRM